jgi:hypothetical protein
MEVERLSPQDDEACILKVSQIRHVGS